MKKKRINPMVNLLKPEVEEFIEKKNWKALKEAMFALYVPDLAVLLRELKLKDSIVILRMLPNNIQSKVFSELDSSTQERIIKNLTNNQVKSLITELNPDDRTELFEEISPKLTQKLINLLPSEERKEALKLLGFPESSVGRLMTPDYVIIKPDWTIDKAMKHIREFGKDAETIDMLYVVDDQWKLLDDIPIRRIILANSEQKVSSIMDHHFISITVEQDQEEAIKLCDKYNLTALPVTDYSGHLLGIVTVDDIIDTLQEENTEDFTKFSAIEADTVGLDFITRIKELPFHKIVRARITWLLALLIMDLITGSIIQSFEGTIAKYVVLVTFLPVLVDTAGNAGAQSATLLIRALALGTVKLKDWTYLLMKELLVSSTLGIAMGIGISVMGIVRGGSIRIAEIVVVSMIVNVIVGSLIGVILPFIFTKFKKDPATASTPLITTLSDIIGTGIYLGIATLFLR